MVRFPVEVRTGKSQETGFLQLSCQIQSAAVCKRSDLPLCRMLSHISIAAVP
jgi:hypothetical protein